MDSRLIGCAARVRVSLERALADLSALELRLGRLPAEAPAGLPASSPASEASAGVSVAAGGSSAVEPGSFLELALKAGYRAR